MTDNKDRSRIRKNIIQIFTGTFLSRIFGFVREMVVGWFFGTSRVADAFSFALMFPNLFRQILGEDMVERAFMPPFKTIYDKGEKERSWKFLSVVFNWFFFALLAVMTLLYLITPLIFMVLKAFEFKGDFDYDLSLELILIMMPFMVFIGLAAFVGSLLNFFERNWIFGFAPIMLSVGVIAGIVWFEPYIGGYSIAVGYLVGAFLQFIVHIPFLISKDFKDEAKVKYSYAFKDSTNDYGIIKRETKIIGLNAVFNKSAEFIDRLVATMLHTGATSSLFYAQRLFQLPGAIIGLSITRGLNPLLNKIKTENDRQKFSDLYFKGCRLYFLVLVPVTVICIGASDEIIKIVYQRGAFNSESARLTSQAFIMYSLGLIPLSYSGYYMRVLSLVHKNIHSLKVSVASAIINVVLSYILAVFTPMGHSGIAFATSVSLLYNMIMLHKYIGKEMSGLIDTDRTFFMKKDNLVQIIIGVLLTGVFLTKAIYADITQNPYILLTIKTVITGIVFGVLFLVSKNK
ncbi:MAG TPA: murein biosynthesis integral membrane protein MurJ [Clostridiales bacterium]|nr:murein biosynthesis integral membrane protein MurJ [Clostridiales bacterium]HQP69535.1 murein biosynthesis integral membrane protein MurJ [Clostridiales bacterium]